MENNAKILLCDENPDERKRIADFLFKSGFSHIDEACDGEGAVNKLISGLYDVAIVDLWLSVIDGIGIIRSIQKSSVKNALSLSLKPFFMASSYRA